MICESRIAEDKAKKAMIDAARLADELRGEQENAQHCEKNRRNLENQVKDMQTKLDEAEQQAVKGGRKVTSRLERRSRTWSLSSTTSSAALLRRRSRRGAPLAAS